VSLDRLSPVEYDAMSAWDYDMIEYVLRVWREAAERDPFPEPEPAPTPAHARPPLQYPHALQRRPASSDHGPQLVDPAVEWG
jgi:hypothetical protein